MLVQILKIENLIFYILAAEVFLLLLVQLRTNVLIKRMQKLRGQKKEALGKLKHEVKNGVSEIPVVKFEKQKSKPAEEPKAEKDKEKNGTYDATEMAVLQEMMAEFFG